MLRRTDEQRIASLADEIAHACNEGLTNSKERTEDARTAARTILDIIDTGPSHGVPLTVRFHPSNPREDAVELPDGRALSGVQSVRVHDDMQKRTATIEIRGVRVLGER